MCIYCNLGDHAFRHNPPWDEWKRPYPDPLIPHPLTPAPIQPWDLDRLREYRDLLKEVRDLEEKVGCPCEPNKADYIARFDERIAELKQLRDELDAQH